VADESKITKYSKLEPWPKDLNFRKGDVVKIDGKDWEILDVERVSHDQVTLKVTKPRPL
jgi:hypothetical protein